MVDDATISKSLPAVLIVEDNETYRKVVLNAIRAAGYQAYDAENGLRGLEIVRSVRPGLVLIDIYMPAMDGMTMLVELKKDEQLKNIPCVMLTNVQEELDHSVKQGASEALLKSSLTPTQVVDICRKYLSSSNNHPST